MNTKFPVRFSFLAAFPSAVLVISFLIGSCHQDPHASAQQHYVKAQAYLQKKQTEAALIELARATQLFPEMANARGDLAKLYLSRGQIGEGVRELRLLIRYNPEEHDAYRLLGDSLLRARDYTGARDIARAALEKWPKDLAFTLIFAECSMATGDLSKARTIVDEAVKQDPKNARARLDLALLQLQNKDWQHAEENLRLTCELDPSGLIAPQLLGRLLEASNRTAESESVFKHLAETHRQSVEPLYALATFYIRHKEMTEAEQVFKEVKTVGQGNPRDRGALAAFYGASGQNDAAEKELRSILAVYPNDGLNARSLAEIEIALSKRDEARRIASDLVQKDARDWESLMILARLDIDDNKPDQALKELDQAAIVQHQSPMLNFLTARCYLLQGKMDEAKKSLRDVLSKAPDFAPARVIMAGLELNSGQTRLAIQDLNRAILQNPSSLNPHVLLSQAYAMEGEYRLAEESLDRFVNPATTSFDQALVFRTLAWVKFRQGRFNEAIELSNRAARLAPVTLDSLRVLGLSYIANKQPVEGLHAVQSLLPNTAEGQQVLGELAFQANKLDIAESAFRKELEMNQKSSVALFGIAQVQRARGDYDSARRSFQLFAAAEPLNAAVHLQLGSLAELREDWPGAISEYETALKMDATLAVAKNNLAWLYAEHGGNILVALRLAQEARSSSPKDPHVADTLGWVLVKMGSPESALPYLKECTAAAPTNPAYHYHLGTAYLATRRTREAKSELERALRLQKAFDGSTNAEKSLQEIRAASPARHPAN